MLNEEDKVLVQNLVRETGCGYHLGFKALDFVKKYNTDNDITMLGYVKAKTLAVATPNLSFLERVKEFSK